MLTMRDAISRPRDLATAKFATLRLRLLKIAARVIEVDTPGLTAIDPRPPRLRRRLSRSRAVPLAAERTLAFRAISGGADASVLFLSRIAFQWMRGRKNVVKHSIEFVSCRSNRATSPTTRRCLAAATLWSLLLICCSKLDFGQFGGLG